MDSEEIRRFEEQYRSNPDSLVFARLADAHRKAGDAGRGLSILEEGIRRHPDYPSAHIVRARCLIDLDRPAEAEASLRRVLELDGQNRVAMRGLASLAEKRDDPVEAVHWFEQIAALDPMNAEAEVALERLRRSLPRTPPGVEPLPAPSEEWWSSPAFQIDDEGAEGAERDEEPEVREVIDPEAAGPAAAESAPLPVPPPDPAPPSSGAEAWWFEDPGDDEPAEDGDLLTRTMAELYVKQGLTDEAAAIYRELLRDRPDDEQLRRALDRLESGSEDEPARPTRTAEAPQEAEASQEAEVSQASESSSVAVEVAEDAEDAEMADEVEEATVDAGAAPIEAPSVAPTDRPAGPDPYASHPVPAGAGDGEVFRDWLRRFSE